MISEHSAYLILLYLKLEEFLIWNSVLKQSVDACFVSIVCEYVDAHAHMMMVMTDGLYKERY